MTNAEIYLKAAELIDSGKRRFSCVAIPSVSTLAKYELICKYAELFGIDEWPCSLADQALFEGFDAKQVRVLMLCLMAAICENE